MVGFTQLSATLIRFVFGSLRRRCEFVPYREQRASAEPIRMPVGYRNIKAIDAGRSR